MKPDRRLINTKVYVNGHTKEILEKLFQLGFTDVDGENKITPYERFPFLLLSGNGKIKATMRMDEYKSNKNKEVSECYIMSINPEPEFKPFDRVLVRDNDSDIWIPAFFSFKSEGTEYPFDTIHSGNYRYCIPYEGNEHLAFTCDSPYGKKEETDDKQQK